MSQNQILNDFIEYIMGIDPYLLLVMSHQCIHIWHAGLIQFLFSTTHQLIPRQTSAAMLTKSLFINFNIQANETNDCSELGLVQTSSP